MAFTTPRLTRNDEETMSTFELALQKPVRDALIAGMKLLGDVKKVPQQ